MQDTKAELHMHTKMSRMRGLISPKELVEYAIDNQYQAECRREAFQIGILNPAKK